MDLKDFVADTLRQIIEGVADAQSAARAAGARINPPNIDTTGRFPNCVTDRPEEDDIRFHRVENVQFDVAVVVERDQSDHKSVGVKTVVVGEWDSQSKVQQQTTSRVKFTVPLMLPPSGDA